MTVDFQKVADAMEESPEEIKNLMFSVELADKIGAIAEENHLEEETALRLFDEVGYVILGLKSRFNFLDLLDEIGIEKEVAGLIAKEVESRVFSELDKIKNKNQGERENEAASTDPRYAEGSSEARGLGGPKEEIKPQSGVGEDFEQIILNQVRAMQPAVAESYGEAKPAMAPKNLPMERSELNKIHDYPVGNDPYREPAE